MNLNIPSNNVLQLQTNNSFTTTPTVLKDQYSAFSSDQFSVTSIFFNYETKPRKHKNNKIINTSTGSYTSYRENLLLTTKQRASSNLKSDDSSSETHTAMQPKKLPRFRKATNNDLIDTDISTSALPAIIQLKVPNITIIATVASYYQLIVLLQASKNNNKTRKISIPLNYNKHQKYITKKSGKVIPNINLTSNNM